MNIAVLGQAATLAETFKVQPDTDTALHIFLSVIGAVATIYGILMPLTELGLATVVAVAPGQIAKIAGDGGALMYQRCRWIYRCRGCSKELRPRRCIAG